MSTMSLVQTKHHNRRNGRALIVNDTSRFQAHLSLLLRNYFKLIPRPEINLVPGGKIRSCNYIYWYDVEALVICSHCCVVL